MIVLRTFCLLTKGFPELKMRTRSGKQIGFAISRITSNDFPMIWKYRPVLEGKERCSLLYRECGKLPGHPIQLTAA